MPSITVRHVPDDVRNELASRAAAEGRSLQEFMLALLSETASKPAMATLLERVRANKREAGITLSTGEILAHRDADRS
jgi:plasmid stability protein